MTPSLTSHESFTCPIGQLIDSELFSRGRITGKVGKVVKNRVEAILLESLQLSDTDAHLEERVRLLGLLQQNPQQALFEIQKSLPETDIASILEESL